MDVVYILYYRKIIDLQGELNVKKEFYSLIIIVCSKTPAAFNCRFISQYFIVVDSNVSTRCSLMCSIFRCTIFFLKKATNQDFFLPFESMIQPDH